MSTHEDAEAEHLDAQLDPPPLVRDLEGEVGEQTGALEQTARQRLEPVAARTTQLQDSRARLETAAQAAGLGVWTWDMIDDRLEWDARTYEIFGVPEAERDRPPSRQEWLRRVHPQDRASMDECTRDYLKDATSCWKEYRILLPNGETRYLLTTVMLESGDDARPRRAVGFVHDITETKLAELALRRSEQRLENILSGTDAGTWEWDLKTNATVFNERWAAMIGYSLADLAPHSIETWTRLTHPEDRREVQARLARCIGHESEHLECELRLRHRDGHWAWMFVKGRVVESGAQGEALRMAGIQLDISARKQAEQSLAEQAERFRRFFEDNGSVMMLIDPVNKRIESANRAAVRFYGYPIEQLIGMRIDDISQLPGEEIEHRLRCIRDHRLSAFPAPHRLASGEIRQVQIYASPIRIGDRSLLFSIIHDETARLRAEEQLRQAKQEAEDAARAKGDFLARMSHEIRTPMNAILGLAELALQRPLEPIVQDYLEKLHGSGQHLLGILNDILDQSRIDAGQLALSPAPFDLLELVGELLDLFEKMAGRKGLELSVVTADDVPRHLVGDALRLRQVLANLICNAIKFTAHGHVQLQVTCLGVEDAVARLRWVVSDTGPGIDASHQAQLFEPFRQVDQGASVAAGGTGLGLSICRALVELLGGEIGLESTPGLGSRFSVELALPITDAAPAPPTPAQAVADLHGVRVLVAEDHPVNRRVIFDMLALLEIDAVLVATGQEALDALQREHFDAVLMDIQMPEMDGLTATTRLRERPEWAELPVIVITAGVTERERERVAAVGASGLLPKPVSLAALADILGRCLPRRPAAPGEPDQTLGATPRLSSAGATEELAASIGADPQQPKSPLRQPWDAEMLSLFLETVGADLDEVVRAIDRADAADAAAAHRALHRLKGACAVFGAKLLQERAQQVSDLLKQGEPVDRALTALRQAYQDLQAQIQTRPSASTSAGTPARI